LRYSQLAQPAHAKAARMNRTAVMTNVLRFTEIRLFDLLYEPPAVGPTAAHAAIVPVRHNYYGHNIRGETDTINNR
jgi:hypothetical protein